MVSDNQLIQYLQIKDVLVEGVISEPFIHSAYYVESKLAFHSRFGQSNVLYVNDKLLTEIS